MKISLSAEQITANLAAIYPANPPTCLKAANDLIIISGSEKIFVEKSKVYIIPSGSFAEYYNDYCENWKHSFERGFIDETGERVSAVPLIFDKKYGNLYKKANDNILTACGLKSEKKLSPDQELIAEIEAILPYNQRGTAKNYVKQNKIFAEYLVNVCRSFTNVSVTVEKEKMEMHNGEIEEFGSMSIRYFKGAGKTFQRGSSKINLDKINFIYLVAAMKAVIDQYGHRFTIIEKAMQPG